MLVSKKAMEDKKTQEIIWQEVMDEMALFGFQDWLHHQIGNEVPSPYRASRISMYVCCPLCFMPTKPMSSKCLNCGLTINKSIMKILQNESIEYATFAWSYRTRYESDINKGFIKKGRAAIRYFLPVPEDGILYITTIIIVAILGGLGYDGFKKIISKLKTTYSKLFLKEIPQDEWLQNFYRYLEEYLSEIQNPNSYIS